MLVGEREVRGREHKITVWSLPQPAPPEVETPPGSGDDEQGGAEQAEDVEGLVDGDPQAG